MRDDETRVGSRAGIRPSARCAAHVLLTVTTCAATPVSAQDYPARPIRLIVATAPGGLMDVAARSLAEWFERANGQKLLVENRGGGGGVVAGDAIAKATPDGYTLAQIQLGNVAVNPFIVKNLPFDPLTDFTPVSTVTSSPVVLAIDAKLPARTVGEFVALAKREPGKLNFGTAGPGTMPHLSGEVFSTVTGTKLTAIHYRGAGPALADLLSGQVQAIFVGYGVVKSAVGAGNVRVLAASQRTHLAAAPDVPTADAAGIPGFEVNTWFGIVGPKGLPERIVMQLNRQIQAMLDDPATRKRLIDAGLEPLKESPAQFAVRMRRDHERFRPIVEAAGLVPRE